MRALHDSRSQSYRLPYGAVPAGGAVRLVLDAWDVAEDVNCELRTWSDGIGEGLVAMGREEVDGHARFACELGVDEPRIVWYGFRLTQADGTTHWYGAADGRVGGVGELRDGGEGPSFQITVYEPRQTKPDWYRGGIVYQVFPDRFQRGTEWRDRVADSLGTPRRGPGRALVEDWDTPPSYARDEQGRVTRWDFYGGTLSGIRERLDYLRDLGVTCIYLNPVFEAASNHRYDTADYLRIDPMLGDEDEFGALCLEARAHGIRVILDGVFNHTGCDSRYFNKYGNYDTVGAWQSEDSPYRSWYRFRDPKPGEDAAEAYDSWWGVGDLPDLEEADPGYRELVFGKDGVVRRWLRAGASGWRLDVADELPDDFLRELRAAAVAEKDDALVLGEVWEDASNKISYGKLRRYILGDELDSVMNYNLRAPLLDYVMGRGSARELTERLETMRENYPPDAFAEALNVLGTHDTVRLFTYLGGAPDKDCLTDAQRAAYRLDEGQRGLAKGRLWLAALLQMTLPGVPCVYYGDEAGVEGYADPYNRATFPWGHEDRDCQTIYRNAINLRRTLPMLADGDFEPLDLGDEVFGFARTSRQDGECAVVLANSSLANAHEVRVPMRGEVVDEVIGGRAVRVENGEAVVWLGQLGSAVLYFHEAAELGSAPRRGSGILCHVTSLPAATHDASAAEKDREAGTLGAPARAFCDWLERAGQRYWQILPVNPTDAFGSPYAGLSAFAGNASLVSAADRDARLAAIRATGADAIAAEEARYQAFVSKNEDWLTPYAAFMAIKELVDPRIPWQDWPAYLCDYDPEIVRDGRVAPVAERIRREQYEFQVQWDALREYAHAHGVSIVGDMPMYVSGDSADVWANRDLFRLDAFGRAQVVAGTPPDAFSADGQVWGNPGYDWDAMRAPGYDWGMRRLGRAFELYDYVRLDHFLGFSSFFAIPRGEKATEGRWRVGPGREIFEVAHERFGALPVIAEDLGLLTPAVRALVAACGFAGMDVSVFSDTFSEDGWVVPRGKVAYSSTHDTQTLVGWCAGRAGDDAAAAASRALEACERSSADLVVVQLQDACGLGDDSRMNLPGVAEGNWSWVADARDIEAATRRMRSLAEQTGRL